jgi:FAD/FMN-containing dehydrogenase
LDAKKSVGISLKRGAPGFDAAVLGTSFNAHDPGRRPEIVVQANNVFDVVAAVKMARDRNLKIGMCSGGHSWAQNHIRNDSVLIDLSRLNQIEIDTTNLRAIIGPGCLAGDLNKQLAKSGLFFPVAHAYTVGMGGFLLQGGFGWNSRNSGMGCENVVGLDLILADGTLVHANEAENSDLYWAARGSGPGFFAVVVRFHLKLFKRPKFVGLKMQVFRARHLTDVFQWADKVGPSVHQSVEFQMVLNQKAFGIGAPGIEVVAPVLADSWAQARDAVRFIDQSPIRKKSSISMPLFPISLNMMMNIGEKTLFLPNTSWFADNMWMDCPIEQILPQLTDIARTQPPAPSHALWLNWNAPATRTDMAFSMEARTYLALYGGLRNPTDTAQHANWATEHMRTLAPFSKGIQLADENTGRRPARFVSDQNLARLDEIRKIRDPEARFNAWMGRPDQLG